MYAKVINPKTNGKKVYDNKGSSLRTANYLAKESKDAGEVATFFGAPGSADKPLEEVVALLDGNVKGLKKDDAKFYSLVLSPSQDELRQIGDNPKALEKYTQHVMDDYAKNFTLKNGRELGESNLVWVATIHDERKNRGTDEGKQGERKEGPQTHIHVIVSARDSEQKITLNPLGTPDRFNRVQFQAKAVAQLEIQFGRVTGHDVTRPEPTRKQLIAEKADEITTKAAANKREKKPLTEVQIAAKDARLDTQVARVNTKLDTSLQLDPGRVKEAAKARNYDNVFYDRLGKIERNAEKGTYTHNPDEYLATGRVSKEKELRMNDATSFYPTPPPPRQEKQAEFGNGISSIEQTINKMSRAMAAKSKTQDVRSEAEKDREHDLPRMAELRFEMIPAAEKRLATYEAEANSTPIVRELLVQQNELQPEKAQNNESRVLEEQAAVSAVLESLVTTIPTQQLATVPAGNEEIPVAETALAATPPVTLPQAVVMPTEQNAPSVPELQQGLTTEVVTPLPIAKVDDHLKEPVPIASFSERETKGVIVDPHDTVEASQQPLTQQVTLRQTDEEAAKEALVGMHGEQALMEATEKDIDLTTSQNDYVKIAYLRYELLPEIAQRLADYRMQAEATPVGRDLLAELDQAQRKAAEQARSAEQERQKAADARVAEQRAAQAAVDGVRQERALLEASRREAIQAEQQGDTAKVKGLRGDIIPQTERRLAAYQVQAETTVLGRTLLAELNEQEKAAQRAGEVLGQLAAKRGFVSYEEFGQKADESGYTLPLKLYGQPQQVVEKSSGRQVAVPLIGGQPLEKVVDKAIRVEENARLHQKIEMKKLEEARAMYTRYSGKEVVRVRVDEAQVESLRKRIGSGAIPDEKPGLDGRIGVSIIYNPSSNASMISEVAAQVRKSGGEVFERTEETARRERSIQTFASSIGINFEKKSDQEIGG